MTPLAEAAMRAFPTAIVTYRKGFEMAEQYDNTNRGSLWPANAVAGKANFCGVDYHAYIVATGATGKAPTHKLFLEDKDVGAIAIPLWREDNGKPSFASGKFRDHWVNVFKNDKGNGNPKAPAFNVQFKAMGVKQEAAAGENAGSLVNL